MGDSKIPNLPVFDIWTDHSALEGLISIKHPVGRLARWAIYIQAYTFGIKHTPREKNANAYPVSRIPIKYL